LRADFCRVSAKTVVRRRTKVARKTVLVCDSCGNEVDEGKGAVMRVTYNDARRGAKQADLCDNCAGRTPGRAVARRGRKPKSATAA
jgi:DNA-directed RNA polymerase subunit M/transcription elongation factor TFIIS